MLPVYETRRANLRALSRQRAAVIACVSLAANIVDLAV